MGFFDLLLLVGIPMLCIPIFTEIIEKKRYQSGKMTKKEKEKYEAKIKQKEENRQKMIKASTITKVIIIGSNSNSRKKAGSSIMRGAVGGALLGPAGLVGGALSGKNETTNETTFLVEYADGHKETRTVINNSQEFQELCKYLEM